MIFPTVEDADLQQWRDDALIECHNDDALWGFVVQAYETVRCRTENQWDNPVFLRLMQMGCLDWVQPDFRSNPSMQGIRFATAMGSRLYERIRSIEREVCRRG